MIHSSSAAKIYKPSGGGGVLYAAAILFGLCVGLLERGTWIFLSLGGLTGTGIGMLIVAYVVFFGSRWWVYLYDNHLEIHPRLAKLIKDHLGTSLYTPKIIYYQQIQALRRTRGFGYYNALVILLKDRKRSKYAITRRGVENYADLEAELLRRVPPTCELSGVDFLGHDRPFK
jgi:hypothetical protein